MEYGIGTKNRYALFALGDDELDPGSAPPPPPAPASAAKPAPAPAAQPAAGKEPRAQTKPQQKDRVVRPSQEQGECEAVNCAWIASAINLIALAAAQVAVDRARTDRRAKVTPIAVCTATTTATPATANRATSPKVGGRSSAMSTLLTKSCVAPQEASVVRDATARTASAVAKTGRRATRTKCDRSGRTTTAMWPPRASSVRGAKAAIVAGAASVADAADAVASMDAVSANTTDTRATTRLASR